jgi:hypothetical protein
MYAVNGVITDGAVVSLVGLHDHWRAMGYTSAPWIFP